MRYVTVATSRWTITCCSPYLRCGRLNGQVLQVHAAEHQARYVLVLGAMDTPYSSGPWFCEGRVGQQGIGRPPLLVTRSPILSPRRRDACARALVRPPTPGRNPRQRPDCQARKGTGIDHTSRLQCKERPAPSVFMEETGRILSRTGTKQLRALLRIWSLSRLRKGAHSCCPKVSAGWQGHCSQNEPHPPASCRTRADA